MELRLLHGLPLFINEDIPVHSVSFRDILIPSYGYENYNRALNFLILSPEEVNKLYNTDIVNNDNLLWHMISLLKSEFDSCNKISYQKSLCREVIMFLELVFQNDVNLNFDSLVIEVVKDDSLLFEINTVNFSKFQTIIKLRNCIVSNSDNDENPADEKTRLLLEKRRKCREKLRLQKKEDNDNINMADLMSVYASEKNIPLSDILEFDIYQFNNQFNRLVLMKDYNINIQALLHGASKDDREIKNWISKIEDKK